MNSPLKVYNVNHGPYHTSDIPGWNEEPGWMVVCLVEQVNGSLEEEEIGSKGRLSLIKCLDTHNE